LRRSEEIASAALFLASESSYVAGIDLPVDGGLTVVAQRLSATPNIIF